MDYLLENLGPERFQEVCHALLAKAFPNTQCFPVGQRDGGRDAIAFFPEGESDGYIVYQVKYVRKPLAEDNPHRWLTETLREEAHKIQDLIPKGAREYYLMTNVPGTAYLDSGSIDTVQSVLTKALSIPARCWWRDDINRRLDDGWNIKWSYPEILSGPDILRYIIEHGLREDAERRTSAIRAFIRDQFDRETEVRFKQVELQNKLLDLFIDVPLNLRDASAAKPITPREFAAIRQIAKEYSPDNHVQEELVGAATVLLHPLSQSHLSRVVIEGAPGQGKSTIVQYICQVHRQRILNKQLDDSRVPESHRQTPVRLPLKIDCRDFSAWLSRQNPFSADVSDNVPSDWQKSLESFVAAQILHYSGGAAFSVSDLQAVAKLSAILLVFDGLDEVADIARRREVVDQIAKGVNRLDEIAVSVQTIVTSRPAAFANSPGLPESTFRYLSLASITRPLIDEYADKWLKARKLDGKESSEVRRILRDKLDQPHLRELARNPMQLAILLSLIQTRGGSLPDKRTALYDSYVELFFNREAEKSTIVRNHRDLLIDIHRYLAWILHAESQTEGDRGSVSADRLRQLVSEYLINEDRDASLAQQLFTGMVERVVALVSRVEGTYEFEVQPLREYFAARHLYNTAPYSPPGSPQNGTLPERFDALCRDFYWQNVTRFYAGCYSKGELPSLVDRLEELSRTPEYKNTGHPQSLAATLLADWVFAQHPRSMKQVVSLVLSGLGLRHVTSGRHSFRRDEPLVLPKQSGNEELVERCFELLANKPPLDFARMLLELIRVNAARELTTQKWLKAVEASTGRDRTNWIRHGLTLGVLPNLSATQLAKLLDEESEISDRLIYFLRAGHRQFVEGDEVRFKIAVDNVLNNSVDMSSPRRHPSAIERLAFTVNPYRYTYAFRRRTPLSLAEMTDRIHHFPEIDSQSSDDNQICQTELSVKCNDVFTLAQNLCNRAAAEWATELDPWNQLVERARQLFGDRWAMRVLANASAGIRSKDELCEDATNLNDSSRALCRRTRYARLRAGVASWWELQLESVTSQEEVAFTLMILLTWAGPTVLTKQIHLIDEKLSSLDTNHWSKLNEAIQFGGYGFGPEKRNIEIDVNSICAKASERMIVALSSRVRESVSDRIFQNYLADYEGSDQAVLEFCQQSALRSALQKPDTWRKWLPVISRSYAKGVIADRYLGYRLVHAIRTQELPIETAEEITTHCECYPTELVALAEQTCRQRVAEQVIPVGRVAEANSWFRL